VVALATGEVDLPPDILATAGRLVADLEPAANAAATAERAPVDRVDASWPRGVPEGGRHGFTPRHRGRLGAAVDTLAAEVAAGLPDGRILVLGSEELRSPVLPVDEDGYAIRSRLRFTAPEPDPTGVPRFAYNVGNRRFDAVVLVVDGAADTPALWAPDGLVEALRGVCGALTVAVVPA
jgi:hypothetical protein